MTFSNETLRDWLDIYEHPQEFPEIGATSDEYARLHRLECYKETDAVLSGLKDFPFAGTCTARFSEGGMAIVEVYHHFFKLSPNGVKYDPDFETMYCIKGLVAGEKPKVVEFVPEFADTLTCNEKSTPWLSDFIDVAFKKQTVARLRAPDNETIEEGMTEGLTRPTIFPRKMFGVIPPFLMKCFSFAGTPSLILKSIIEEIQLYASENLDEPGAYTMWQSFYPLMQRLWIAQREEEEGGSNHNHFFLTHELPPTSDIRATKEGADIERKYLPAQYSTSEGTGVQSGREAEHINNDRSQFSTGDKLNTFMEQFVDLQARAISLAHDKKEEAEKEENWHKRMNVKTRKYILFASVSADRIVPERPDGEYKIMLDNKKEQSLSYMQSCILIHRNGTQVVDNNLATSLWNGILYNANLHGPPMGLSIFYAVPAPLIGGEPAMSQEEMSLRQKSNNMPLALIKNLTTSQIQIPKDDNDFIATLENFTAIVDFVLGTDSYVLSKVKKLSQAINKNKSAFKGVCASDKNFIPSLMQAIDIKIQLFIASCAQEDSIDDVNFRMLDFTDEVNCILTRKSIGIQLPTLVKQAMGGNNIGQTNGGPKPGKRSYDFAEDHEAPNSKRKASFSPAKNSSPVDQGWIKKGENYNIFQPHVKSIPSLNGYPICAKYHVKGICTYGDECQRKSSHNNKFDESTKAAFSAWVAKCRQSAGKN